MNKSEQIIRGQDIGHFCTLKSWYDNDSIMVFANGKYYRMKVDEIIKMVNNFAFTVRKARIHEYLEVIGDNNERKGK